MSIQFIPLILFSLVLSVGCTRDPVASQKSAQPTDNRPQAGGAQNGQEAPNVFAPTSVTGDAREPGAQASESGSTTNFEKADGDKSVGTATSVGTLGSTNNEPKQQPTNTGTMPRDRKGVVGSRTASNVGASQPAVPVDSRSQIDVSSYSFERRTEFKSFMQARLEGVDRTLETLKTKTNASSGGGSTVLRDLTKQEETLKEKLASIETVKREGWDTYKQSVRNDVAVLERSVEGLSTSSR